MKPLSTEIGKPRGRGRRKAQSLIEFALCLPLLLVILGGVIDTGLFLWKENNLTAAVREGALFGARLAHSKEFWDTNMDNNIAATKSYIRGISARTNLKDPDITITTVAEDTRFQAAGTSPDTLTIRIQHKHNFLTPFNFTLGSDMIIDRSYTIAFIANTQE